MTCSSRGAHALPARSVTATDPEDIRKANVSTGADTSPAYRTSIALMSGRSFDATNPRLRVPSVTSVVKRTSWAAALPTAATMSTPAATVLPSAVTSKTLCPGLV